MGCHRLKSRIIRFNSKNFKLAQAMMHKDDFKLMHKVGAL